MHLTIDESLLERIKVHLINIHSYPPCTAKVCALLFFDYKREGISFDDIIAYFEMSKSTVSSAINQLLENQHITFIFKNENRKRFFLINKEFVINRYKGLLTNLIDEKELLELMQEHKNKLNIEANDLDERLAIFINTITRSIQNLSNAVVELKKTT